MLAVILAGGSGTRLWPLSRKQQPKQFQRLFEHRTLLELTRLRLGDQFPSDALFYSVTEETLPLLKQVLPNAPARQIIVEPEKRDTGPAMGFVAAVLELTQPDEPLAFIPSDHYIRDHERFRACLQTGEELIRETGCLVDIGVTPTWPNTNLGYTHIGERLFERNGVDVFAFRGHAEKPPVDRAKQFIASGEYLWHANYYMWTARKFLEAYAEHAPEIHATLRRIQALWRAGKKREVANAYATLEKISIDYAVTEKLDPAAVRILKAPFDWSDVGLWSVLKDLRQENPQDNVIEGADHVSVDTNDCLIVGQPKKVIATIGVADLVIVDTPDALLVCRKDRDQDVKKVVEELTEQGRKEVL